MRRQLLAMLVFVPAIVILTAFFYTVMMAPPSAMRWLFFLIHLALLSACLLFAVQVWLGRVPAFGWRTCGAAALDVLLLVWIGLSAVSRGGYRAQVLTGPAPAAEPARR